MGPAEPGAAEGLEETVSRTRLTSGPTGMCADRVAQHHKGQRPDEKGDRAPDASQQKAL